MRSARILSAGMPLAATIFVSTSHATIAIIVGVLLTVSLPFSAHADAFTLPAGQAQTISTLRHYSSDRFVDGDGVNQRSGHFSKWSLNSYHEYGWREGLTLGASLDADYNNRPQSEMGTTNQLSDQNFYGAALEIFARQRLWQQDGYVLALQPRVKLPNLYKLSGSDDTRSQFADAELALQAGTSRLPLDIPGFATTSLGYRTRFGTPNDQWKWDVTLGIDATSNVQILLQQFTTLSTRSLSSRSAFTRLASDDYDLSTTQISAVYRLNESWRVQAGAFHDIYARNTGIGGGALLGLWWTF